jgi:hypothetical protein
MGTGDHLGRKRRPLLRHAQLGCEVPAGWTTGPMAATRPEGDASVVKSTSLAGIAMFIVLVMMLNVAAGRAGDVEPKRTFAGFLADI